MKLVAKPLFEGPDAAPFPIDTSDPRQFVDLMDQHKALVFQTDATSLNGEGGKPLSVEGFGALVSNLKLEYYPYIGGAAPRTIIPVAADERPVVFTANESPPEQPIPFHHELAQTANPPEYVFFYCDTPAERGGQTPIIDSTEVYRFALENHRDFIHEVKEHGARYIRTLPAEDDPQSPIGRSYKNAWGVSSREELDAKLATIQGCSWEWNEDGSVRITSEPVPAIRLVTSHCQNQVYQWTFANSLVAAFLGWQDCRNDRLDALRFGNDEKMSEDVLQSIADFMARERVMYKWQSGDVMALNNRLVMHSREPFSGKRRVLASIWGGPVDETRLAQPKFGTALGLRPDSFYETPKPDDPLVFGFWKVPQTVCAEVCYQAIKVGYRRLDCACDYGNEVQVGQGISRAIKEGLVTREDLFVTSKLWNTYHDPSHVPLALEKTLIDLGLDYVDEYLIHFPISMEYVPIEEKYPPEWTNMNGEMVLVPNDMCATWKAMEMLVDEGRATSIGVCNFTTQLIRQILSTCRIRPSTLQVELHPHNAQERLVRFARDCAGMTVTGFSCLGASSYLELDMANEGEVLLMDPTVLEIAKNKRKSPAQVLIRWALQRNTRPLCKSVNVERMIENRNVFDFYLTGSEMAAMAKLNKGRRYNDPGDFCEPGMGSFCPIYE